MPETGSYPVDGEPRVWVVVNETARIVQDYIGPNALYMAEKFIDRQDEKLVLSGHFGIDYAEYRRCCHRYLHPEADCACTV